MSVSQVSIPSKTEDVEAELAQRRRELKRLAKAVALTDGVEELVVELQEHQTRVRELEADLAATQRTPEMRLLGRVETVAREKLADMRRALAADPTGAGTIYRALFPDGLIFKPIKQATRRAWEIRGIARLGGCNFAW